MSGEGEGNLVNYRMIAERRQDVDVGTYMAYGIALFDGERPLRYIPDVFLQREKAQELVACCNRLALDPIHLDDVIEDML